MAFRVVFLHGLEGSPNGTKAQRLRGLPGVELVAPDLETGAVQAWRAAHPREARLDGEVLDRPLAIARQALEGSPHLVVASSFGGALALKLAVEGLWPGPLVLLAPAGERVFGRLTLPQRAGRVVIVHGRDDEVVPPGHSLTLASSAACEVVLWLVNDEHRLTRSVEGGVLDAAVQLALRG